MQRTLKSNMWKLCNFNEEKTSSLCNLCKQPFKYKFNGSGGSTGGIRKAFDAKT